MKENKNWFAKHKIITVILALIVIGSIGGAAGGGSKSSKSTTNTSSSTPATEKKVDSKVESIKIGTATRDGKFEFTVKSVECGKASVGTNEYLTKTAQGQYCLLNMTIKNIGNEAQSLFSGNQYLLNASGQKYSADDSATLHAAPSGSSWYNNINPGNSVEGTIVFDIPKDQTPATAELHDSSFSGGIKVSLQ
jgi:hypothetical protein